MAERGYASLLLEGLAQHLHESGVGTYSPDGSYPLDVIPITFGALSQQHEHAYCLTTYLDLPIGPAEATDTFVQVRTRGGQHPLAGLDLTDAVRDALHDRRYLRLGRVTASHIRLDSFVPLGPDSNGRFEWTQNFQVTGVRRVLPE